MNKKTIVLLTTIFLYTNIINSCAKFTEVEEHKETTSSSNKKETLRFFELMHSKNEGAILRFIFGHPKVVSSKIKDETALMFACKLGLEKTAAALIDADVASHKNDWDETALHIAIQKEQFYIVKLLIDHDRRLLFCTDKCGDTPFAVAILARNLPIIKYMLSIGVDINAQNNIGDTPLHEAASRGLIEIVKLLLENGANPNIANNNGDTPLFDAICRNHSTVAKLLLSGGSKTCHRNLKKESALTLACKKGNIELVKVLLSIYKCNPNIVDENYETPVSIATQLGNTSILHLLRIHGAIQNNDCVIL